MKYYFIFWLMVVSLVATCFSAICLTASLMTRNERGMMYYGVATIVAGVIFKACLDVFFD
jgi:uncharacterized membrane protein HdeD (DUF308 family)